jgi:hypothetical protein
VGISENQKPAALGCEGGLLALDRGLGHRREGRAGGVGGSEMRQGLVEGDGADAGAARQP